MSKCPKLRYVELNFTSLDDELIKKVFSSSRIFNSDTSDFRVIGVCFIKADTTTVLGASVYNLRITVLETQGYWSVKTTESLFENLRDNLLELYGSETKATYSSSQLSHEQREYTAEELFSIIENWKDTLVGLLGFEDVGEIEQRHALHGDPRGRLRSNR